MNAVLSYIAKYTAKSEVASKSYIDTLLDFSKSNVNEQCTAKEGVMKIVMSNVGERDYSAQEVAHILMGWPLYRSSREFVTVYVTEQSLKKIYVSFITFLCIIEMNTRIHIPRHPHIHIYIFIYHEFSLIISENCRRRY